MGAAADPLVVMENEVLELQRKVRSLGRPLTHEERTLLTGKVAELRERVGEEIAARYERPQVISAGRPRFRRDLARGRDEALRRLRQSKQYLARCSECPAAQVYGEPGSIVVRCGVEHARITERESPQSLVTFCLGDYRSCPSWRAERRRIAEGAPELVKAGEGE